MWGIENSSFTKIAFSIFFLLLIAERVENTFAKKPDVKKSLKVFHRGFFYILLGSYLVIILTSAKLFFQVDRVNLVPSIAGAAILLTGVLLRRSAIRALNGYWSVYIEIKEDQRLVREGIYRHLKHPYYTAVVLELTGFALLCNAYSSILLILAVQIPLIAIRVHYENRILDVYGRRLGFSR